MSTEKSLMNAKIFVGGVSVKMTQGKSTNLRFLIPLEQLENYFSTFGKLKSCILVKSKKTNQPLGFAFLEYESANDAQTVLASKHEIDGRDVSFLVNSLTLSSTRNLT